MLGFQHNRGEIMDLTPEEWNELVALKEAITLNPASVHWDRMERFGDLMVRTLEGKSDGPYDTH